jgi:hypothetical protein
LISRIVIWRRPWRQGAIALSLCLSPLPAAGQGVSRDYSQKQWEAQQQVKRDKEFWDAARARQKQIDKISADYRDSLSSFWAAPAKARRLTPQQLRFLEISEKVDASGGRISAADEIEMGLDLFDGLGVHRDAKNGLGMLAQVADGKGPYAAYAQFLLGNIYWNGVHIPRDQKTGLEWYRKSASNGNILAQSLLADMFLLGNGVSKDFAEAQQWAGRLENELSVPAAASPAGEAGPPGKTFRDDHHRAYVAVLIAAVAILTRQDYNGAAYWVQEASHWGCQDCTEMLPSLMALAHPQPTEPYPLNLRVLGVTVTLPAERGNWVPGSIDVEGRTLQTMVELSGEMPLNVVLDYRPGMKCDLPMNETRMHEKVRSFPLLADAPGLVLTWYPLGLLWNDPSFSACRDLKDGHMMLTVILRDAQKYQPPDWPKRAFAAVQPVVDQIVAAWGK